MGKEKTKRTHRRGPVNRNRLADAVIEYTNPKNEHLARVLYDHLLLNPEEAELVGVPMSVGGIAPVSMKLRFRQKLSVQANTAGELFVAMHRSRAPQFPSSNPGSVPGQEALLAAAEDAVLPFFNTTTGSTSYPVILFANSGATSITTPAYGVNLVTGGYDFLRTPAPLIEMKGSRGRVVAQELRIYPTGDLLTTRGVGAVVQPSSTGSLNDQNFGSAYSQQSSEVELVSLTGWQSGEYFSLLRVPLEPQDVNWINTSGPTGTQPSADVSRTIGSAFFASGCAAGQPFLCELHTVYEFRNTAYPFGTPNDATIPFEPKDKLTKDMSPMISVADRDDQDAAALAQSTGEHMGPPKAAGFWNWLKGVLTIQHPLAKLLKPLLPKALGMAAQIGSRGLVDGRIVEGLTEKLTPGYHPMTRADRRALPPPSVTPSDPRITVIDEDEDDALPSLGVSPTVSPTMKRNAARKLADIEDLHSHVCISCPNHVQ